jgi:uncharacterized protein (DUF1778 family)
MARSKRVPVYLTEEELALIEEAAWRRKVKRGEWIRGVLLATAKRTIEDTDKRKT